MDGDLFPHSTKISYIYLLLGSQVKFGRISRQIFLWHDQGSVVLVCRLRCDFGPAP
jgi:hypothetical protein